MWARDRDRIVRIDAIFTDQSNLTEREEQAPMMREIYTLASGVLVHIMESPEVRKSTEFLKEARLYDAPDVWMKSTVGVEEHKEA
jgi:hypothetical protein